MSPTQGVRSDYLQSPEAEAALVGSLLMERAVGSEVDECVAASDFADVSLRKIFTAQRSRPEGLDLTEVRTLLQHQGDFDDVGGQVRFAELMEAVPSAHNATHYARLVREAAHRRRLEQIGRQLTADARSAPTTAAALIEGIGAELCRLDDAGSEDRLQHVSKVLQGVFDAIAREQETPGGVTGVDTGFHSINRLTGGWQRGSLIVVAARPSVGKTTLALTIALHAALREKTVLFVSAEMSAPEIARNTLCHLGPIDSSVIRTGRMTQADWSRLNDAANRCNGLTLFLDDSARPTPAMIRNRARRLKLSSSGLDLVIVDYLQLLGAAEGDTREQQVASLSRALKIMARELDVPVIALAQLNRASVSTPGKRPTLSDIRESGAVEQDADVVVLLHPLDATPTEQPQPRRQVEAIVAKNRNGPTGAVQLTLVAPEFRFEEGAPA